MSLIKKTNAILDVYSNRINQNYYVSTYYALTNSNIFIDFKNPISLNNNSNFYLSSYIVDFGDGNIKQINLPNTKVSHKYQREGNYFISYSAIYILESNLNTYEYQIESFFTIKNKWDIYDPNKIRLNEEIILNLPYSFEEIEIQPNEWGVEDIFNNSIYRLQECLDYLIAKSQTINTYSPTTYFGWLGNFLGTASSTIKWTTETYNSNYLNNPELAKSTGKTYFSNLLDFIEFDDYVYLIDNNKLKIYQNSANPEEIIFDRGDETETFLSDPIAFDLNDNQEFLYITDKINNLVYKTQITVDSLSSGNLNIQLFVGGYGGLLDNNGFNTPTQISCSNNDVYILDYNNLCIKHYNQDLNWQFTYNILEFDNDKPISIASLKNGLLYVLTENYKVYVFDYKSNTIFESFSVENANDGYSLLKICVNENNDFIYILTEQFVYKYTVFGSFVSVVNIPKTTETKYKNIKSGKNGFIFLISEKCVIKFQDILEIYQLGDGLPYEYWDKNQLTVLKNEFVSDLNFNRSLIRMIQNIKSFRNTLNARFIVATENVKENVVTYFSYLPIDLNTERPLFSVDIENETLGVGANELHIPSVINKELKKIYDSLLILNDFLSIKNYSTNNLDCLGKFCWSWDATSCYKLKLPVLKTCSINPISFQELKLNESNILSYAPSTRWIDAKSKCCEKKDI